MEPMYFAKMHWLFCIKKFSIFGNNIYISCFFDHFILFCTFFEIGCASDCTTSFVLYKKRRPADCYPASRVLTGITILLFHLRRMLPDFL